MGNKIYGIHNFKLLGHYNLQMKHPGTVPLNNQSEHFRNPTKSTHNVKKRSFN